ncbi:hypothetical protein AOLI_G00188440 [Acnodon oligacanthus]
MGSVRSPSSLRISETCRHALSSTHTSARAHSSAQRTMETRTASRQSQGEQSISLCHCFPAALHSHIETPLRQSCSLSRLILQLCLAVSQPSGADRLLMKIRTTPRPEPQG